MPDRWHAVSAVRLAKKNHKDGNLSKADYKRIRRKAQDRQQGLAITGATSKGREPIGGADDECRAWKCCTRRMRCCVGG